MAPKSALTTGSRILFQQEQLHGQLCVRCFHASRIRRADEATASTPSPEDRLASSKRWERAARVSQSIEAIAKEDDRPDTKDNQGTEGHNDKRTTATFPSGPKSRTMSKNVFDLPRFTFANSTTLTSESLVSQGAGTATIAASRFEDVVRDRLRMVTRPGRDTEHYTHDRVGPALMPRLEAQELAKWRAEEKSAADGYGKRLSRQVVAGTYDPEGILSRHAEKDSSTLGVVDRAMLMNPSYLADDAQRFSTKVKSLLPLGPKTPSAKQSGA